MLAGLATARTTLPLLRVRADAEGRLHAIPAPDLAPWQANEAWWRDVAARPVSAGGARRGDYRATWEIEPPTLGELRQSTVWAWANCNNGACWHSIPIAITPYIIRWGAGASSDMIRQRFRCSRCGHLGATMRMPSHDPYGINGQSAFPTRYDDLDDSLWRAGCECSAGNPCPRCNPADAEHSSGTSGIMTTTFDKCGWRH